MTSPTRNADKPGDGELKARLRKMLAVDSEMDPASDWVPDDDDCVSVRTVIDFVRSELSRAVDATTAGAPPATAEAITLMRGWCKTRILPGSEFIVPPMEYVVAELDRRALEIVGLNALLKQWQDEHRSEQERRVAAQEGIQKLTAKIEELSRAGGERADHCERIEMPEVSLLDKAPEGTQPGAAKRISDLQKQNEEHVRRIAFLEGNHYPNAKKHHLEMLCNYLNTTQKMEDVPGFYAGGDVAEIGLAALVQARQERDEARSQLAAVETARAKAMEGQAPEYEQVRQSLREGTQEWDLCAPLLRECGRRAAIITSQSVELVELREFRNAVRMQGGAR